MCYLVWKGLSLFMTELGFEPNSDDSDETRREFNKLQIILRVPIRGSGHVTVSYIPIYGISDDDPIHRRWQLKSWELRLRNKTSGWPWSYFSTAEDKTPGWEYYIGQIQRWLDNCTKHHDASARCRLSDDRLPNWVPTRLLEINDQDYHQIRLMETRKIPRAYTAVSYSWGQEPIDIVTQKNYPSAVKDGIPWKELPQLHQDAVRLTHSLGIRYIWIDAACIIQQDAADFESESNMMAEVYHHAILVISTAHARDVHCSLLPTRREPVVLQNEVQHLDDGPNEILAYRPFDHRPLTWQPPRSKKWSTWPTLTRAWTLQERLLATRVVQFAPQELVWECTTQCSCECGGLARNDSLKISFDAASLCDLELPEDRLLAASSFWRLIMVQASSRALTKDSDRLIANAGLARRFHETSPELGRYLAGVWEADLLHSLSWEINTDDQTERVSHVAPSWSWASIRGEIWIDMVVDPRFCTYHATCLSATCVPKAKHTDPQAFAAVESGYITLRAPAMDMLLDESLLDRPLSCRTDVDCRSEFHFDVLRGGTSTPNPSSLPSSSVSISTSTTTPSSQPPCTAEAQNGDVLKLVFLWSFSSYASKRATALVLKPNPYPCVGGQHEFRRIGAIHLYPWDDTATGIAEIVKWIGTLPEESVTLI